MPILSTARQLCNPFLFAALLIVSYFIIFRDQYIKWSRILKGFWNNGIIILSGKLVSEPETNEQRNSGYVSLNVSLLFWCADSGNAFKSNTKVKDLTKIWKVRIFWAGFSNKDVQEKVQVVSRKEHVFGRVLLKVNLIHVVWNRVLK